MVADVVPKRGNHVILMAKPTCEGLRKATGASVRSWAALPQKPTLGLFVLEQLHSCLALALRWRANRCGARKYIDDDHRRSAVPADEGRSRFDDGFQG